MNRKIVYGLFAVLIIAVVAVLGYSILSNNNESDNVNNNTTNNNSTTDENIIDDNIGSGTGKTLVVYYSATGNTRGVAKKLAENLNADTFEIVPSNPYTDDDLDWNDDNSRVSKEHDDESLRDVELESTTVPNFDTYDTVLIGYPIWWGIAAWPVNSFVEANDFTGKTVIPFCTSSSSGIGNSADILEDLTKTGTWQEGIRFGTNPSDDDINDFIDSIS
ncbi:MAG TPA: flavodoxin [Candidatus Onthousia excrementipullorum]|uniref:Flavodoxin n=1 Tax=Candidatus Onthousia excrementipullorum TaxID=2840884 RepID=A0A9D1DUH7_9FIRM|nr:flavodoxin [Candidatus Onthousia excrementipullorum]